MPNFTDPNRDGVPVHRAPRRQGVRLRAPARLDRSRAGRRDGRGPPQHERRLPAAGGLPGHRHPDQRGRLLGAARHTTIYSLNGYQQNIANPDGPIQNYRCNGGPRGAHLCQDPANDNAWIVAAAQSSAGRAGDGRGADPQSGELRGQRRPRRATGRRADAGLAVRERHQGAQARSGQPDPGRRDHRAGGAYTVAWVPESGGQNTQLGELWPEVDALLRRGRHHDVNPASTMSPTDGSFGDPGVREPSS